jgi:hypothetical protein
MLSLGVIGWAPRLDAAPDLVELGRRMGGQALHLEVLRDEEGPLHALLDASSPVDVRDLRGATPLHWAAGLHREAAQKLLLEHGADPNAVDMYGMTPLHFHFLDGMPWWSVGIHGELRKKLTLPQVLLDHGADPERRDLAGVTPAGIRDLFDQMRTRARREAARRDSPFGLDPELVLAGIFLLSSSFLYLSLEAVKWLAGRLRK